VIGAIAWIVDLITAILTGGGGPSIEDKPPAGGPGTCRGDLLLPKTRGHGRARQPDLDRWATVWRGPVALLRGVCWQGSDALIWAPSARWKARGAKEFLVPLDALRSVEVTDIGREKYGVVLRTVDGDEVWLLISDRGAAELVAKARGYAS
jgi:hypothetical protein